MAFDGVAYGELRRQVGAAPVLYAVFDALHKLPSGNNMPEKQSETDQSVSAVPGARVMKNFDAGGVPSQCAAETVVLHVAATSAAAPAAARVGAREMPPLRHSTPGPLVPPPEMC